MRPRKTIGLLGVLALALAGCAGQADMATAPPDNAFAESAGGRDLAQTEQTLLFDTDGELSIERQVIVTSRIDIRAEDTRETMDDVTALVVRSGGFVAAANVNPSASDRPPVISMTIRVPSPLIGETLDAIRDIAGEVVSESLETQDVTEEYVDIGARLRNLQRLEEELVAFLTEARNNPDAKTDDVLQVFVQVSDVRAQIEQLQGRMRFLDDRVDLATIGVTISPLPSSGPIVDEGWMPGLVLRDALRNLVSALQGAGDAAIWLGVFALPLVIVIGSPIWVGLVVWLVLRRRKAKRASIPAGPGADRLDSSSPSNPE